MRATEREYRKIGGVPLRYVRVSPVITEVSVQSTRELEQKLDRFTESLTTAAPARYGRVRWIATAGAYVPKPGDHGKGRAFDLDVVRWRNAACRPNRGHHASDSLALRRRYVAVDALARRWFKYVLDGEYNASHRDHMHFDTGGGAIVFNSGYRSDVVFIQKAANVMIGARLTIDGEYGPLTNDALRRMKRRTEIDQRVSASPRAYRRFLWRIAVHGLRNKPL